MELKEASFLVTLDYFYLLVEAINYKNEISQTNEYLNIPMIEQKMDEHIFSLTNCMKGICEGLSRLIFPLDKLNKGTRELIHNSIKNKKPELISSSNFNYNSNIIEFNNQLIYISTLLSNENKNENEYSISFSKMNEKINTLIKEEKIFNE